MRHQPPSGLLPLREVGPQVKMERHGGIGYELVLFAGHAARRGDEVVDRVLAAYLQGVEERRVQVEVEKEKEKGEDQEIRSFLKFATLFLLEWGEVPRVYSSEGNFGANYAADRRCSSAWSLLRRELRSALWSRTPMFPSPQVVPQKRISKRIVEQIADDPAQQVIPQKRISQRIVKQSVDDPVPQIIPQKANF